MKKLLAVFVALAALAMPFAAPAAARFPTVADGAVSDPELTINITGYARGGRYCAGYPLGAFVIMNADMYGDTGGRDPKRDFRMHYDWYGEGFDSAVSTVDPASLNWSHSIRNPNPLPGYHELEVAFVDKIDGDMRKKRVPYEVVNCPDSAFSGETLRDATITGSIGYLTSTGQWTTELRRLDDQSTSYTIHFGDGTTQQFSVDPRYSLVYEETPGNGGPDSTGDGWSLKDNGVFQKNTFSHTYTKGHGNRYYHTGCSCWVRQSVFPVSVTRDNGAWVGQPDGILSIEANHAC